MSLYASPDASPYESPGTIEDALPNSYRCVVQPLHGSLDMLRQTRDSTRASTLATTLATTRAKTQSKTLAQTRDSTRAKARSPTLAATLDRRLTVASICYARGEPRR